MAPIQHAMLQITNDLREDLRKVDDSLSQLKSDLSSSSDCSKDHVTRLGELFRTIRTKVNILATILTTESDEILKDVQHGDGFESASD